MEKHRNEFLEMLINGNFNNGTWIECKNGIFITYKYNPILKQLENEK